MALGTVPVVPGSTAMATGSWADTYATATQVGTGLYAASEKWCFTQTAANQAPIIESVDQNTDGRHHSPKKILKSFQQRLLNHVSGALEKLTPSARRYQPDPSFAQQNSSDDSAASIPVFVPTPPTTQTLAPSPTNPTFKEGIKRAFRDFQLSPRLSRMFSGSTVTIPTDSESSSESSLRRPSAHHRKRPKLRSFPKYSRRAVRGRDPLENWSRGRPIWIRDFGGNRAEYVYYKRKRQQVDVTLMSGANDASTSPNSTSRHITSPSYAELPRQGWWYRPQTQWTHVPVRHGSLFRHPSWPGIISGCASPNSLPSRNSRMRRPALLLRPTQSPGCASASTTGSYFRMFLSKLVPLSKAASPSRIASFQTPTSTSRFVSGFDIFIGELDFEMNEEDENNEEASRSDRDDVSCMDGRRRGAAGRSTSFSGPISLEKGSLSDWEGFTGWQPFQTSSVVVPAPQSNGEGPSTRSITPRDESGTQAVMEELSEDDDTIMDRMFRLGISVNIRRTPPQESVDEDEDE
jgi:hypothetical protein